MLAQPEDTDDESDEEDEDNESSPTSQSLYSNLIKTYCTLLQLIGTYKIQIQRNRTVYYMFYFELFGCFHRMKNDFLNF